MGECRARSGGQLDALCRNCDDRDWEPSPYVMTLNEASLLVDAGFPMSANTYELQFWLDLGVFRQVRDGLRMKLF